MHTETRNYTPHQNNQQSVCGRPLSTTMQSSPRVHHCTTCHYNTHRREHWFLKHIVIFLMMFYFRGSLNNSFEEKLYMLLFCFHPHSFSRALPISTLSIAIITTVGTTRAVQEKQERTLVQSLPLSGPHLQLSHP